MNMINLIKGQQLPYQFYLKRLQKILKINMGLLLFLGISIFSMNWMRLSIINQDLHALQNQMVAQAALFAKVQTLQRVIHDNEKNIQQVKTHQDETMRLIGFLKQLPQDMPEHLYLVNLSWHEHAGIIYGQANDHRSVLHFLEALKNNLFFKQIALIKSGQRHEQDGLPPIFFVMEVG
jgi:Tfp pilus assembly protein PilN